MDCLRCRRDLGAVVMRFNKRAAGVEYMHAWWWCEACRCWTQETYKDGWNGSDLFQELLDEERGQAHFARILECPDPTDDRCDCPLHRTPGALWA